MAFTHATAKQSQAAQTTKLAPKLASTILAWVERVLRRRTCSSHHCSLSLFDAQNRGQRFGIVVLCLSELCEVTPGGGQADVSEPRLDGADTSTNAHHSYAQRCDAWYGPSRCLSIFGTRRQWLECRAFVRGLALLPARPRS